MFYCVCITICGIDLFIAWAWARKTIQAPMSSASVITSWGKAILCHLGNFVFDWKIDSVWCGPRWPLVGVIPCHFVFRKWKMVSCAGLKWPFKGLDVHDETEEYLFFFLYYGYQFAPKKICVICIYVATVHYMYYISCEKPSCDIFPFDTEITLNLRSPIHVPIALKQRFYIHHTPLCSICTPRFSKEVVLILIQ